MNYKSPLITLLLTGAAFISFKAYLTKARVDTPHTYSTSLHEENDIGKKTKLSQSTPFSVSREADAILTQLNQSVPLDQVAFSSPYTHQKGTFRESIRAYNKINNTLTHFTQNKGDMWEKSIYPASELICRSAPHTKVRYDAPRSAPLHGFKKNASQSLITKANNIKDVSSSKYQSKPTATKVIYLDFDGETINQAEWLMFSHVSPIVTTSSNYTNAEILTIAEAVAEDFAPFNVNVTTTRSIYDNTETQNRVMCITTPDDAWYTLGPDAGGVAIPDSFIDDIVCWSFITKALGSTSTLRDCATTISHEVGHTLGLSHDGNNLSPYQTNFEHGNSASWAPIMGAGATGAITQWSKGDYFNANQTQDDLQVITSGGLSFRADDHGNDSASASPLILNREPVSIEGIIERETDQDFFRLEVNDLSTVQLLAESKGEYANLDIKLTLLSNSLEVVQMSEPKTHTSAYLSADLSPGVYFIRIEGDAEGSPNSSNPSGWVKFGSLGYYTLNVHPYPLTLANSLEVDSDITLSSEDAWSAQTTFSANSEDAIVCKATDHGESVSFSITARSSNISFSYKISSESSTGGKDGDSLSFYIDNQKAYEASGQSDWISYDYQGLTGSLFPDRVYTFRWEYKKDDSLSEGFDRVWIDNIVFDSNSTFEIWTDANSGSVAVNADTDQDGIPDISEYSLGTLPNSPLSRPSFNVTKPDRLLTFSQRKSLPDVSTRFLSSSDLENWETIAVSYDGEHYLTQDGQTLESIEEDTLTQKISLPMNQEGSKSRFIKVDFSHF